MAESSQSSVKSVSHLLTKIDVVKFDGINNFGMWRREVMDPLTTSNLEDSLRLKEKSEETSENDWDKMNWTTCGIIRFYLTQNIKYHVLYEIFARKIYEILEKTYLTKSVEFSFASEKEALSLWLFIGEHMNNYTKFLADLVNVDVEIKKEDKAVILLNSLLDEEYRTFVLILINDKQTLNYSDVSVALINCEVRRKDK